LDIDVKVSVVFMRVIILFSFLQRVPPLRIDDLIDDLKDGTKLLALLEVLSGEKLVSLQLKNHITIISHLFRY
jgi:hypothetical protein